MELPGSPTGVRRDGMRSSDLLTDTREGDREESGMLRMTGRRRLSDYRMPVYKRKGVEKVSLIIRGKEEEGCRLESTRSRREIGDFMVREDIDESP